MRKYQITLLSFLFPFITACTGQLKTDSPEDNIGELGDTPMEQILNNKSDVDPYFIEGNSSLSALAPRTITRNIIQDRNGKIWFATFSGIVKYDEGVFSNITDTEELRRHRIFSLMEDNMNNIWFGTIGAGIYKHDGTTFKNYTTEHGLPSNDIESVIQDDKGNIWFGSNDGVCIFDGKSFRQVPLPNELTDNEIHSIIQDKSGKIWVGSSGGIFYYDGDSFISLPKKIGLPFYNVRTIIEDKNGKIWFGGSDGLFTYDGVIIKNILKKFTGFIYEDSKGNIWISAGEGVNPYIMTLYRYAKNSSQVIAQSEDIEKIKVGEGLIFGITEDNKGNIWFGTTEGLCRYDGKSFNYFRDVGDKN